MNYYMTTGGVDLAATLGRDPCSLCSSKLRVCFLSPGPIESEYQLDQSDGRGLGRQAETWIIGRAEAPRQRS